jgi:two-component system OmpR family sensor kinase/two-component system sensor histidine kinase BaeS
MINRLWFRLTSAFALVIVVGVLVTVVVARQGAASRFAHFMLNHHMVRPEQLQATLIDYYVEHNGWYGLDTQLASIIELATDGTMSDVMGNMMGMNNNHIQVIDATGAVVADSRTLPGNPRRLGQPMTTDVQRWPLLVNNTPVGELLAEGGLMVGGNMRNNSLVAGVTRAVLIAGMTAGLVGLVLALLLVRQITRPLGSLTRAAQQIAGGDLSVRVPVQSNDELGDLATTFNQMAGSLETQGKLRRNLMADVAHELRTPLAGIQGTVEALQDGVFPMTTENLQAVHDQVTLLNRLVEDLRTLANAEAGQLSLDQLPLNLVDLCQRQVTTFQPRATAKGITLTFQSQAPDLTVCGDDQRLGQVLNNLLDNALRHTPTGGAIQVEITSAKDLAHLAVIDNGEGITAEALPHLFDRFYRGDHSRDRRTGGSGLGLAIARQFVQAHGGRIWAESPPVGRQLGSAFIIELPRK